MSEEINDHEEDKEALENQSEDHSETIETTETITRVTGMYKDWFLEYASYVILERAVPGINDGFKPVQRRIMHSMKDLDDGRYNKVANIVGHTMQYHPHGDASIADAMVQLGQKELLIDMQGNLVYGTISYSRSKAVNRGPVGYAYSMDDRNVSQRVGSNPLFIEAVGSLDDDIYITSMDANKVRTAEKSFGVLSNCRVMLLLQ